MALTVTSRPEKDIDGSTSTWNAINLPIQYKFSSNLFPVNSEQTRTVSGFSNNNGFLEVVIVGTLSNILEGEAIQLSACDVESFNGIWKVKEVISTTNFVLIVAFDVNLTAANFQKYYNNYFAEIKVYGGLPDWHDDFASKPIAEVGILRLIPDVDNNIIASFSGLIKDDVNVQNQLAAGIELDKFTGFYVEWREGFDKNINGSIETNFTSWVTDEIESCGVDIIVNGDFATDLTGWSQADTSDSGGTGEAWVWDAGVAKSSLASQRRTKYLYQEVNMVANIEYELSFDIARVGFGNQSRLFIYGTNDLINFTVLYKNNGSGSSSITRPIVPSSNFKYIAIEFNRYRAFAGDDVTIDNISLTSNTCQRLFWGSNSSLQFQNIRGGNMYDNIARDASSKFMSIFNTPTLFEGNYFDTSIILGGNPVADLDLDEIASIADMWLVASDIGQANGTDVLAWVDRTTNVTVVSGTNAPTYKLVGINGSPSVRFDVDQSFTTDTNISQPVTVYAVFNFDSTTATIYDSLTDRNVLFVSGIDDTLQLLAGDTVLTYPTPLLTGTDYVIKAVSNGESSKLFVNNVLVAEGVDIGDNGLVNTIIGMSISLTYLNGDLSELLVIPSSIDACTLWQIEAYLGDKYDIYSSTSFGYTVNEYDSSGNLLISNTETVDYKSDGVYRIAPQITDPLTKTFDLTMINAAECLLSETKTFNYNNDCENQEIYLTWFNTLGGWEYWKFTAEKNHNLNIESKETIKRNILSNWDNTFINGDTENDVISVGAFEEIEVFSQYLTREEAEAISTIKYAIKVQVIKDGVQTTVIVDSDSILIFNDGDDETLQTIKFNIQYPSIQIQSQ